MRKRLQIEGSPAAKMVQIIREKGFNKEMSIEVGIVISPLPDIKIRIGSNELELDKDDLIVAEHLTEHTRLIAPIVIGNTTVSQITFKNCLKVGDKVTVVGDNDTQYYYVINKVGD